METKQGKQLYAAREHFYAGRCNEAYAILRRYYDRLPFRPEQEHGELIGIFIRTLLELGKQFELNFYMMTLEQRYEQTRDPHIGYALGMVYFYLPQPRMEAARKVFEEIALNPSARALHTKAKINLAHYYDLKDDVATCRMIIDSAEEPEDAPNRRILSLWKAKLLRDEKRFEEAEAAYEHLLREMDPANDWYSFFLAHLQVARLYLMQGYFEQASKVLVAIRQSFVAQRFKSVQAQIDALAHQIEDASNLGVIYLSRDGNESTLSYQQKSVILKRRCPSEKLLLLLARKRVIDKESIVEALYGRNYEGEQDDKLIYYHVHSLRKRLKKLGLPAEAISSERNGYRLVPKLEHRGEEL